MNTEQHRSHQDIGRLVITPTLARQARAKSERPSYMFTLLEADLSVLCNLGDAALIAFALIRAAAWGPRASEWVTIKSNVMDGLQRGYRWWHSATDQLEKAGVIECERQRGRLPRYRLKPATRVDQRENQPTVPGEPDLRQD